MNIIHSFDDFLNIVKGPYALALGNYDGVHLGHQKLIENHVKEALQRKLEPCLITFSPHPKLYFSPGPYLIQSKESNYNLLNQLGVKHLIELPFTKELQSLSAEEFISKYLYSNSNLKMMTIGYDFALGEGKQDAFGTLRKLNKNNIIINQVDAVEIEQITCSSSHIRDLLIAGDVKEIAKFLGRRYSITSEVIAGMGIGSKEIVPTANIQIPPFLLPPKRGVYHSQVELRGEFYKSITNVGLRPTLTNENNLSIETYILDFNDRIYTEEIEVIFIERARDEIKFASVEELKETVIEDIKKRRSRSD